MSWAERGQDWPNRETSRFVTSDGLTWHVQIMGQGPVVLLAHGTGASTHSWRGFAPALARHFTVVAPDLPGHGFTDLPASHRLSLPGMARAMGSLMQSLAVEPRLVIGHSAGAAILARMILDRRIQPAGLISLNGAWLPFDGMHGQLFSAIAKLLVGLPPVPRFFAWRASNREMIERLLRDTGSALDPVGLDLYARLARDPKHVGAALGMMANWELQPLKRDFGKLNLPVTLVAATGDRTIPPLVATRVATLLPQADIIEQAGLGHLSHEEQPEQTAALCVEVARKIGVLPAL